MQATLSQSIVEALSEAHLQEQQGRVEYSDRFVAIADRYTLQPLLAAIVKEILQHILALDADFKHTSKCQKDSWSES